MRRIFVISIIAIQALIMTCCATKTETGALTGGAMGALAGGLIGQNAGGVLIGGAMGALAGGLIGHSLDEQQKETIQRNNPDTYHRLDTGQPLTMADIKALSNANVSNSVIISQIKSTHTIFRLSTSQIIELKESGVNQQVIDYMIQTGQ